MTNYDGQDITYDSVGNPKSYNGWTYTWEGKNLIKAKNVDYDITYQYDDHGIRTEKTVNGVTTRYHLDDDKVTYETNGTDKIYYTYDANGDLVSMNLNGIEYYYIYNGQGDVTGLIDNTGTQVVSYTYDTWGNLLSTTGTLASTVGEKNPYRYRAYRYDTETGLYYLQSRYYNPEWGRFINADGLIGENGNLIQYNLFAYCNNNPVNIKDPDGYYAIQAICVAIGAVAGWKFGDYIAKRLGYSSGWKYWAIRSGITIGGAVFGWFTGTTIVNIAANYIIANPSIAKRIPNWVLDALGVSRSGLRINNITNAINNIVSNSINHIMLKKHA